MALFKLAPGRHRTDPAPKALKNRFRRQGQHTRRKQRAPVTPPAGPARRPQPAEFTPDPK